MSNISSWQNQWQCLAAPWLLHSSRPISLLGITANIIEDPLRICKGLPREFASSWLVRQLVWQDLGGGTVQEALRMEHASCTTSEPLACLNRVLGSSHGSCLLFPGFATPGERWAFVLSCFRDNPQLAPGKGLPLLLHLSGGQHHRLQICPCLLNSIQSSSFFF